MGETLPKLPDIERLSPRVIRILGGNPGKFQLQGTNTYLVGTGPKRILIDTGEGKPAWLQSLRRILEQESATVDQVILTHWHHDHIDGVPDLLAHLHPAKPTVYKNQSTHADASMTDIPDGHVFTTPGATLRAVHSPGHAADHTALVLREEDAMFTGDNVLGHGTAVFEDLAQYLGSLDVMLGQFGARAYPGHGQAISDGPARIREYIAHRRQREVEVVEVLRTAAPRGAGAGWRSMEMVKVIYQNYPEALHGPAEGSLKQVLWKLEAEGQIVQGEDEGWRFTEKPML